MVQWWRICLPVQETQETWVLFLGQGQSPGEGNGNPLQYSCLGNPVDRGAWWATVAKNQTQLTNWARTHAHTHTHTHTHTHSTRRLVIQHTFILISAECQALSWMPRFKMNETQAPVCVLTLGCNKWTCVQAALSLCVTGILIKNGK